MVEAEHDTSVFQKIPHKNCRRGMVQDARSSLSTVIGITEQRRKLNISKIMLKNAYVARFEMGDVPML